MGQSLEGHVGPGEPWELQAECLQQSLGLGPPDPSAITLGHSDLGPVVGQASPSPAPG